MSGSQTSNDTQAPNPNTAMPQFTQKPIPGGSVYTAGVVAQKTSAEQQTSLVGSQKGGIKKKKLVGGEANVAVPIPPSYAVDKSATIANNQALTQFFNTKHNFKNRLIHCMRLTMYMPSKSTRAHAIQPNKNTNTPDTHT